MRNLTIKRNKSFVACLVTVKIYIEDAASNDLTIQNIPCRYLGDLKNGEEKTFSISEDTAKIFVIADKLSKEYCNEVYTLPAGEADVFLSGQNRYNLSTGNAFRFDGVTDAESLANRKKTSRKGIPVLIVAFIVGILLGILPRLDLFNLPSKPKTFSAEGMQITLTDDFKEFATEPFTMCFDSKNAAVLTLREPFSIAEGFGDCTLEEYGNLVITANGHEPTSTLQHGEAYSYYTYDFLNPEQNITYSYLTTLFKSSDAFWIIQFATPKENMEEYLPTFFEWANTVTFPTP